jgi:hypothetical protein
VRWGYYVRWGLLGATVGLTTGIILVYKDRISAATAPIPSYPYLTSTDLNPIECATTVPVRVLTKHVTPVGFATPGAIEIPLRGGSGSLRIDPTDKAHVLEAIGFMQLECQDVPGALGSAARIEDKATRDRVLHGFVSWITDRDYSSTAPAASAKPSVPVAPPLIKDQPHSAVPPNDQATAASKAILDEKELKRRVVVELVADCKKLLGGMVDPGIQALTWSRIARVQFFEADDREGTTASFVRAVEAAVRIETKKSSSTTAVDDSATELETAKSDRSSPSNAAAAGYSGSVTWIAVFKEPIVWVLSFLGLMITGLIASILKPIGEGVAKGLGSEKLPELVSSSVSNWKARLTSRWRKTVPTADLRRIDSTVGEPSSPHI